MKVTGYVSMLLLVLACTTVTEACFCLRGTLLDQYCRAEYVILANVVGNRTVDNRIEYKMEVFYQIK